MKRRSQAVLLAVALLSGRAGLADPVARPAATSDGLILSEAPVQGGLVGGIAPPGTESLSLDGKPVPLAPDRTFILGFDRDQAPAARLVVQLTGKGRLVRDLYVAPRSWQIEKVDVARLPSGPAEDFLKRRKPELERIEAARAMNAASDGWRQRFVLPAQGRISGLFGSQRIYRGEPGSFHSGLDIAPGAGAPVVAPADGVVVLAGPPMLSLEGNLLIIDHGMGLNSAFLHLATQDVTVGQRVRQGQKIGTVGATGRATGPHLHWSVKWKDARLDPQALLATPPR